jgi:hypothetical protein
MITQHDPIFGCIVWHGRTDENGYGRVGSRKAHIVAWEDAFGSVPEGFVLDHVCRNRACVALHHLEAVTKSENERRKSPRYRMRRQRCAKGHDLNVHRVMTPGDGIVCRACNREAKGDAA